MNEKELMALADENIMNTYKRFPIVLVKGSGPKVWDINGKEYLLELPLTADFALIKAHKADKLGNLVYRGTARCFNPVMAMAAKTTIVEVDQIVEAGELDPENIVTPHIFVTRIVEVKS